VESDYLRVFKLLKVIDIPGVNEHRWVFLGQTKTAFHLGFELMSSMLIPEQNAPEGLAGSALALQLISDFTLQCNLYFFGCLIFTRAGPPEDKEASFDDEFALSDDDENEDREDSESDTSSNGDEYGAGGSSSGNAGPGRGR
jgi:hypothetical protein